MPNKNIRLYSMDTPDMILDIPYIETYALEERSPTFKLEDTLLSKIPSDISSIVCRYMGKHQVFHVKELSMVYNDYLMNQLLYGFCGELIQCFYNTDVMS